MNSIREQILFVIPLTILTMIVWWLIWDIAIKQPPQTLQQPVYPQSYDFFYEFNRQIRDSAWRNPIDGRKSDFPGGLN